MSVWFSQEDRIVDIFGARTEIEDFLVLFWKAQASKESSSNEFSESSENLN